MKVRHKGNGMVVAVPDELSNWTPDRIQPSAKRAAEGRHTTVPWFKWAQWEPVDESTPLTHPAPADAKAPAKAAKAD